MDEPRLVTVRSKRRGTGKLYRRACLVIEGMAKDEPKNGDFGSDVHVQQRQS